MKIFDINYNRLGRLLLPTMLRTVAVLILIDAIVSPLFDLYNRFLVNRDNNLYRLLITPQVCYLERLLNDRFDSELRRIYLSEGVYHESLFIFTEAENKDVYTFTEAENKDTYIFSNSESITEGADFIVNVPVSLRFDEAELRSLLNAYKLASKTFAINKT